MRTTGKEIAEFCEALLRNSGRTIAEMCRMTGMKKEMFSMWKSHPAIIPRMDALLKICNYLGISMDTLIGIEKKMLPYDIEAMVNMLVEIPENDRRMILMNIKNYYDVLHEKKFVNGQDAG